MPRVGGGENLDELGDDRAGQGTAADHGRQLPPQIGIAAQIRDDDVGQEVCQRHRDQRGEPDQLGQRGLEVEAGGVAVAPRRDGVADQIGEPGGQHHHDPHQEDPDQQLRLYRRVRHGQHDERDERDTGDAVGLEAVGRRPHRIAGVVADAVGDDAWVPGVILLDLEHHLHQVRPDVGDLGENAAGDTKGGGAQRLADGEAQEAGARDVGRNEEQDGQHEEQLDRDEHHSDAHARAQRNVAYRPCLAPQAGKGGAGVGQGVDPDAEPGHPIAAAHADQAEQQDDRDLGKLQPGHHEVDDDDGADEAKQRQEQFALLPHVGLTGHVYELGDFGHRAVDREVLYPGV